MQKIISYHQKFKLDGLIWIKCVLDTSKCIFNNISTWYTFWINEYLIQTNQNVILYWQTISNAFLKIWQINIHTYVYFSIWFVSKDTINTFKARYSYIEYAVIVFISKTKLTIMYIKYLTLNHNHFNLCWKF
jgi:hypothetical protein